MISNLSQVLGLGEITWSPFVSKDESMIVTPFMNFHFILNIHRLATAAI